MTPFNRFALPVGLAGFAEIEPQQLPDYSGARVIDVREPIEFAGELCHIPGAELLPWAQLPARAVHWERDQPIVLVCRSGRRSAQGAELLVRLGFKHVINLRGGMQAYRGVGLPTECEPCLP